MAPRRDAGVGIVTPAARRWRVTVLAAVVIAAGMVTVAVARHRAAVERGRALFEGRTELVGILAAQTEPLPTAATRCANCHTPQPQAGGAEAEAYGDTLDHASLSESRSRHGGPPTRYELKTFCALLHTGQDPAYVIIPQDMPHYEMTKQACADLWAYVQSR